MKTSIRIHQAVSCVSNFGLMKNELAANQFQAVELKERARLNVTVAPAFKADHSEAEPQLVFFKATSIKPAQTNALITTRRGHEISLSLVSQGKSDRSSEPVDYVLNCERPRSFLIASTHPAFVVGETRNIATESQPTSTAPEKPGRQEQDLLRAERIENPHWEGKQLQVAVGHAIARTPGIGGQYRSANTGPGGDRVQL